jgi:GH18 family chitinase
LAQADYVARNGLGGMMMWGLDLDDFRGNCRCGTMALLKAATSVLVGQPADYTPCDLGDADVFGSP